MGNFGSVTRNFGSGPPGRPRRSWIFLVIQLVFQLLTIFLYLYPPADSPRHLLGLSFIYLPPPRGVFFSTLRGRPFSSISISTSTYSIAHVDRGQGTFHTLRLLIPPALRPPLHLYIPSHGHRGQCSLYSRVCLVQLDGSPVRLLCPCYKRAGRKFKYVVTAAMLA